MSDKNKKMKAPAEKTDAPKETTPVEATEPVEKTETVTPPEEKKEEGAAAPVEGAEKPAKAKKEPKEKKERKPKEKKEAPKGNNILGEPLQAYRKPRRTALMANLKRVVFIGAEEKIIGEAYIRPCKMTGIGERDTPCGIKPPFENWKVTVDDSGFLCMVEKPEDKTGYVILAKFVPEDTVEIRLDNSK